MSPEDVTHWHTGTSVLCGSDRHEWSQCTTLHDELVPPRGRISCVIEEVDCEECLRRASIRVLCEGEVATVFDKAVRG